MELDFAGIWKMARLSLRRLRITTIGKTHFITTPGRYLLAGSKHHYFREHVANDYDSCKLK